MSRWWTPLQETASRRTEHKDARLGAALAYYSVFSIGPLIVIAIAIAGLVFGVCNTPASFLLNSMARAMVAVD
jgi:uncharacterized BrkB/YihY/UPF0761 family membrane protein